MWTNVFNCRIYSLRKYKKQIERDEDIAKELQNRNKSNSCTETNNQSYNWRVQIRL